MRDLDAGWGESLALYPDRFSVVKRDTGDANWSYQDSATKCKVGFTQGSVADVLDTTQDDRTMTDDLLASVIVVPTNGVVTDEAAAAAYDEVHKATIDDVVSQIPGPGTVATRTLWGTTSTGETWLYSARAFGSIAGALMIDVNCPSGQDAHAEFQKIVDTYVGMRVGPHVAR